MNPIPQVTKETPRQGVVKMKNISMKDFLTVTKKVEVQLSSYELRHLKMKLSPGWAMKIAKEGPGK